MKTLYDNCYAKIKQPTYDIHSLEVQVFINKILAYKTKTSQEKIDALLELDANMYTNLGSDSSKKDKEETKRRSKQIYKAIKLINEPIGKQLLDHMDMRK